MNATHRNAFRLLITLGRQTRNVFRFLKQTRNDFAYSLRTQIFRNGSLSPRQQEALISAANRMPTYAVEPQGDAPEGRTGVRGTVVTIKEYDSQFGTVFKMLVKLDNNAKVWCSVPKGIDPVRGQRVNIVATWTRKPGDRHFATGKRPRGRILSGAEAEAPAVTVAAPKPAAQATSDFDAEMAAKFAASQALTTPPATQNVVIGTPRPLTEQDRADMEEWRNTTFKGIMSQFVDNQDELDAIVQHHYDQGGT